MPIAPFSGDTLNPKNIHLFFLSQPTHNADHDALEIARKPNECFLLSYRVCYLHAPAGIARAKLAAQVERCLKVVVAARNLRT